MATSGSILYTYSSNLYIQVNWTRTAVDVANNQSTVAATLLIGGSYNISSSSTKTANITVNGVSENYSFVIGSHRGSWSKTIATKTVVVPHNSDGTKSFALSAWADVNVTLSGKYVGRVSVSGSGVLDTIPRASSFSTYSTSVAGGSAWSGSISSASAGFTHTVVLKIGSASYTISGATTSASYTIPLSWVAQIPNTTSGTMTITLNTYSGGTLIGSKAYTATLTVPASVVPTFSALALSRIDGPVPAAWGVYVAGKSKVTATIQSPAGAGGSTIKSYEIKLGSDSGTTVNRTFDLNSPGTKEITATITDSRNRTTTKTATITVEPYSPPALASVVVERCTSAGVPDNEGTYLRAKVDWSLSSVAGKNTAPTSRTITYKQRPSGTVLNGPTFNDNVYTAAFGNNGVSTNFMYDVTITVADPLGSTTITQTVSTALVTMDFRNGGRGVAVGMVSGKDDTLESNFTIEAYKGARLYKGGSIVLDTTTPDTDISLNGDLDVLGKITPTGGFTTPRIPVGANLNNYITPGQWYNPSNAEVAGLTNKPPSNAAGTLVVMQATDAGVTQFWHGFGASPPHSHIYRRTLYSGSWSAWKLMTPASWVGEASGGQRSGVTYYDVTVNFPSGLFSVAPKVFAQINNQAGGGTQLQVLIGNVTTSSCVVGFFMINGTMNGHWCEANVFAIEPS